MLAAAVLALLIGAENAWATFGRVQNAKLFARGLNFEKKIARHVSKIRWETNCAFYGRDGVNGRTASVSQDHL